MDLDLPAPPPKLPVRRALFPEAAENYDYARRQYEAGVKSAKQIADEIGVSTVRLLRRASIEGWMRDPHAKTALAAELKATKQQLQDQQLERAERINVEMQAQVLVRHRTDINDIKVVVKKLLTELRMMTEADGSLEDVAAELAACEGLTAKRQELLQKVYDKVLALPARVDVAKKLTDTFKTLLQLERQAYGIAGALEDPEQPNTTDPALVNSMNEIKDKFNQILSAPKPVVNVTDIIEVPARDTGNQSRTIARSV